MTKTMKKRSFYERIDKLLDKNLKYERHEIKDDKIHIKVKSRRKVLNCPYCGKNRRRYIRITGKRFKICQ